MQLLGDRLGDELSASNVILVGFLFYLLKARVEVARLAIND